MDTKQLICTFSVAGKHYGVVVDNVQEVLANHQITDIPLAPPGVLGLMNIRGRIVPAIALRKVLRLPGESDEEDTINIVINHGGEQVGLMVDCIGDIVSVQPEEIEPPPETLKGHHENSCAASSRSRARFICYWTWTPCWRTNCAAAQPVARHTQYCNNKDNTGIDRNDR